MRTLSGVFILPTDLIVDWILLLWISKVKLNHTCTFHIQGPQSLLGTNLYRNTWWEKSKTVQFCNTLQLFINIVVSSCIKQSY